MDIFLGFGHFSPQSKTVEAVFSFNLEIKILIFFGSKKKRLEGVQEKRGGGRGGGEKRILSMSK